jgi:hypothetical protein
MDNSISFRHFLIENEVENAAKEISDLIKKVGDPRNVQQIIKKLDARDLDDLIEKLENHPHVRQVMAKYNELKNNPPKPQTEGFLLDENWMTSILGGISKFLGGILKWTIQSITSTIGHVLGGFLPSAGGSWFGKMNYAAALLLTFGLAPAFLLSGGSVPGVLVGWTVTWWGLMWFGKNVLEPVLKRAEPVPE